MAAKRGEMMAALMVEWMAVQKVATTAAWWDLWMAGKMDVNSVEKLAALMDRLLAVHWADAMVVKLAAMMVVRSVAATGHSKAALKVDM